MRALFHTMVARMRGFLRRDKAETDFDNELDTHLTIAVEEKIRRGMTRDEAERTARVELGGLAQLREAGRAARGLAWLDSFGLDIKLGLRMMRRSWGLTLAGGLAMALTIGLGSSFLLVWNTLSETDLPLNEGDRVVAINGWNAARQNAQDATIMDFERWRDGLQSVRDIGAFRMIPSTLILENGETNTELVAEMTASGFQVARVPPLMGRPLVEQDERDANPVVVIGYNLWQSFFSSDLSVIGKRVQIGDAFHTVVGVMPEGFAFPVNQTVWIPLRTSRSDTARNEDNDLFVFGRLAPGVTLERAQSEISTLGMAAPDGTAGTEVQLEPRVVSYVAGFTGDIRSNGWIGGLMLFIATLLLVPPCANIAILVYARTVTRQTEFAARYALGASRSRIVGQIFVELLVLAAASGVAGLLLARGFAFQLARIVMPGDQSPFGPQGLPFWMSSNPSLETMLGVAGLVVLAAAIAGGVPAIQATGRWRKSGLHALANRGAGVRLGKTWTALLAAQVALSLAILPSAMEMTWPVFRPVLFGPGLPLEEYLTGKLIMEESRADRFGNLQAEVVRQLAARPGVLEVSLSSAGLMDEPFVDIEIDGGEPGAQTSFTYVDDAYLDMFDVRFVASRGFDATEFASGSNGVIVNRTFAEELTGDANAIGRRVRYMSQEDEDVVSAPPPWHEIVGVVEDFPDGNDASTMFHPMGPEPMHPVTFTLRTESYATLDAAWLREMTRALDPTLRVDDLDRLEEAYRQRASTESMFGLLLTSVMLIVTLFSVSGIYTLTTCTVAQRWREIGLRSALGAQPGRLVTGIFGRALVPVLIGGIFGSLLAFLIDTYVPIDEFVGENIVGIIPASAVFMILVGLLAVAGPARRAIRINPTEALREG